MYTLTYVQSGKTNCPAAGETSVFVYMLSHLKGGKADHFWWCESSGCLQWRYMCAMVCWTCPKILPNNIQYFSMRWFTCARSDSLRRWECWQLNDKLRRGELGESMLMCSIDTVTKQRMVDPQSQLFYPGFLKACPHYSTLNRMQHHHALPCCDRLNGVAYARCWAKAWPQSKHWDLSTLQHLSTDCWILGPNFYTTGSSSTWVTGCGLGRLQRGRNGDSLWLRSRAGIRLENN